VQQKRYRYTGKERDDSIATFAENVGANVQSAVLLLCLVG
jgi:hypothetical protein